ncbi:phage major tail tube protein [Pseudomonas sp. 3A(2025)]
MTPEILFNTNLIIDGVSMAGDVPQLTLPKISVKAEAYRAGGMDAEIDVDMGLQKLESSFSTNGMRREALKFVGLADQTAFNGSFRGAFKDQKGGWKGVVATLRGMAREVDNGDWKPGEKAEIKFALSVSYYKLEIDDRLIYEIDPVNGVRVIDGVDQLSRMRTILGI